jgi:hypothetical protein
MTQKLGGALNGVTSGFAATQGAMALFGNENEALEKSLLKVQSALAIQQGVQGLTEAYRELGIGTKIAGAAQAAFTFVTGGASTALKVFRAALVSTGVGALVVAIGLLVANFDKLLVPIRAAVQGLKDFADAVGLASFAEADAAALQKDAETQRLQMIKDIRASQEEAHKRRMAEMEEERRASEQGWNDWLDILRLQGQEERANFIERTTLSEAFYFDRTKDVSEYTNEELKAYKALLEFDKKVAEERKRNYQEYAAARMSAARQIEDLENQLLEEGLEKELEINRDRFRRLREDAEGNAKERARLRELYTEQELRAEKEIRDKYDVFKTESFAFEIERLEIQAATEIKINNDKNQAIVDSEAEAAKKQQEIRERNKEFAVQTTLDGLSLISDITELFGKKGEKQAKRAFQVQKAAQIAAATIETYRSAQSAYLSQFVPVPDASSPVRGGIAAGVAVAAGLANIAKIASQKFEGGGATGGGADFSGGGVGGGEVAPQFNVVGDAGINQLAQLQQQPTQAYVVSGEVTSAQALDRNRVTNATL